MMRRQKVFRVIEEADVVRMVLQLRSFPGDEGTEDPAVATILIAHHHRVEEFPR
jgi:hypothetical protein